MTIDLVQTGNAGYGQLVLQGTGAAESVPVAIRLNGQLGTQVVAQISPATITLRHQLDGRLFTADLKLSEGGERMVGFVRESYPRVGLVLTREPRKAVPEPSAQAPQAAKATPISEPQPQVAMVPAPDLERKDTEVPTERPKQQEFVAVQELTAIHFEFDKSELRPDALDTLSTHAGWLKKHADTAILIEGTATSAARRSTTWRWANGAPTPYAAICRSRASRRSDLQRSATARSDLPALPIPLTATR